MNNSVEKSGTVELKNPHLIESLERGEKVHLYHLGLDSEMDLEQMFGDIKYVLMGGEAKRAKLIAEMAAEQILGEIPEGGVQTVGDTSRFYTYKVGPVLALNHGIGDASLDIVLEEVAILLHLAKVQDPTIVRIGTSGGVGHPGGRVVIANQSFNDQIETEDRVSVLGFKERRDLTVNKELAHEIWESRGEIDAIMGGIMGASRFFAAQGRMDGAIAEHTREDALDFLKKAHMAGVDAIEMESNTLVGFANKLGLNVAVACITLDDTMKFEHIDYTPEEKLDLVKRPIQVVLNYVKSKVNS